MDLVCRSGPTTPSMRANGGRTKGEWEDDKANGYGIYIHVNGAQYEGYWKNDLQDGQGMESWQDGSRYEGGYKEGMKHGHGKYIWNEVLIQVVPGIKPLENPTQLLLLWILLNMLFGR